LIFKIDCSKFVLINFDIKKGEKEMVSGIIEAVDFRMQAMAREADQSKDSTVQMTVRIPEGLKIKLDVISNFMGGTRNSVLVEFLEIACREAIERIENNPYMGGLTVNGQTISEALAEAMKGEDVPGLDDALHEVDIAAHEKKGKAK
jgi:hypothetical protein